jgi:hypothetical protein
MWPGASSRPEPTLRYPVDSVSLMAIATLAAQERRPLVIREGSLMMAKGDSIGFVVRSWIQCSAG